MPSRLDRADVLRLCADTCAQVGPCAGDLVVCDVSAVSDPDAATVDALARLQLTLKRLGTELRICGASRELVELLELSGLSDVLPTAPN